MSTVCLLITSKLAVPQYLHQYYLSLYIQFKVNVQVEATGPIVECFTCGSSIPMSQMKEHQETHIIDPPAPKVLLDQRFGLSTVVDSNFLCFSCLGISVNWSFDCLQRIRMSQVDIRQVKRSFYSIYYNDFLHTFLTFSLQYTV